MIGYNEFLQMLYDKTQSRKILWKRYKTDITAYETILDEVRCIIVDSYASYKCYVQVGSTRIQGGEHAPVIYQLLKIILDSQDNTTIDKSFEDFSNALQRL